MEEKGCSPEVKAKALALVDEAVSLLEAEGVEAADIIEQHLDAGEGEMEEEPKDKKAMIVLALKKKLAGEEPGEEEEA